MLLKRYKTIELSYKYLFINKSIRMQLEVQLLLRKIIFIFLQ